ncbi:hypothetical protein [Kitasatospora herbaricolor]|uniref:Immunity protein 21 of polymorphic toxin system n=1 Tax=Kitasatospora herbaricolor TaxID=68217 RepID=A0ABZ1W1M6_9ACTN|nr:hypothetical protein [Kitasatospora herbaricolor]
MSEELVELGSVTAPTGVLVLGMASWIDFWPELGLPLSARARAAAAAGGAHLRDGDCEAVAVPAAGGRPLRVRASTTPSWYTEDPVIAVLEVDLATPWTRPDESPVRLGDLPVDRGGMILGDGSALDAWTGPDGEPADGLADVTYWGLHEDAAHERFGGQRITVADPQSIWGLPDLPVARAQALAAEIGAWRGGLPGKGVAVMVEKHTDFYRFERAASAHPLLAATVTVGGCPVLGIGWEPADHSMSHRGERALGLVYPVTLRPDEAGGTVLRWTVSSPDEHDEQDDPED